MAGVNLDDLENDLDTEEKEQKDGQRSTGGFDLLDGIDDDLDKGSGKAWIPEKEGDTIIGFVRGVGTIWSDQSKEDVPLLDIEDKEGEMWSVRGYGKVLVNQINRANPVVGDGIAIRFLGRKANKSGSNEYKDFVVKTRKIPA